MRRPSLVENILITTRVEKVVNWSRATSVWPLSFGLACCAIEMMAASASRWDFDRFGSGIFRSSPRQADLMIVAGTVSYKMAPIVKQLYDQMPEPKWVIAMGSCATCGGPFDSYHAVQGADKVVPVDVYIPGCPPRPEAFLYGFLMLQDKIMNSSLADRYREVFEPVE
nr:NADH-quinone oxidoreductase subunit B family protein [uncultured Holophaga sp.]